MKECKVLLDMLPHSITMCMKVKTTRHAHHLRVVIKSTRCISVTQGMIDIRMPPRYLHSIEWNLHKVRFTLLLNNLEVVSTILKLPMSSNFKIKHVLGGNLEENV